MYLQSNVYCKIFDKEQNHLDPKEIGIIKAINFPETYRGNFLASSATGYAYVEGEGITFEKDTRNHKEGYK
ncbi:4882_t:CDS:2, partial [Entrophospora sp. SA101]